MSVGAAHLGALYAGTDDPWDFRSSPYEAGRLAAVERALERPSYAHVLELGCGNGELARRLVPRCRDYTGLDAVPAALSAARRAAPAARFVQGMLPCALPAGTPPAPYDLVLLSEILYFLDADDIAALAREILRAAPGAPILCINWLGDTGDQLGGDAAQALFEAAWARPARRLRAGPGFRMDWLEAA